MIGAMRYRITISRVYPGVDDGGGHYEQLTAYATRWAEVLPQSDSWRNSTDGGDHTADRKRFRIRYDSQIDKTFRITFDGGEYRVTDYENEGQRDKTLVITAERLGG
jgi:SPP1 family predicted phage head-tail adaptor